MSTFKRKNVIKSYKLRLQEKLKTVTEETESATSFLNNCIEEFRKRVQHILEIKDEKCLSLYRQLNRDLESYSEKLFILQGSFEEATEDESDSSEDEAAAAKLPKTKPKSLSSHSSQNENLSRISSSPECANINKNEDVDLQRFAENVNLQIYSKENEIVQRFSEKNEMVLRFSDENFNKQKCSERNIKYGGFDEDGDNITEDDFHSLNSDNKNSCTLFSSHLHGSRNEHVSGNECASNISFSQSSCYRSISSSNSESLVVHKATTSNQSLEAHTVDTKNDFSFKSLEYNLMIHPPNFEVLSRFSGTLSCITDPADFWFQIENSHAYKLNFPKSEYAHLNGLSVIRNGSYCLAPFKSTPLYYRAQSLSDGKSGNELVKVLFIDHGSTQDISVCDLRPLPESSYEISAQAIHCYIHGIGPLEDSWSHEGTERFKEFQNYCIETVVKSKEILYGVQLVAKLSADLAEDYSVDIAQALCLDNLAVSLNEPHPYDGNQLYESQLSEPVCSKIDASLDVSGSYDINAISNDSGVSVTSICKSSKISNKRNELFHKVSEDYVSSVSIKLDRKTEDLRDDAEMKDLISFEDYDALCDLQNSNESLKSIDYSLSSHCLLCRNKNFCLHLKVPSPSLLFVKKDMVIVMVSHIVNPHEFYVNMAMETIDALDDLREQMISTYESEKNLHKLKINDLTENMFCAGRFNEDGYWYRIKIIQMSSEDKEKNQVLGQYIDYGNTSVMQCCDLRPLTSEFSKHPAFAIKCALAGVNPITEASSNHSSYWNEDAIAVFKKLTSFERCLTAQIHSESSSNQNDTYPVLLWDTEDSDDLLINASLAEHKMAHFDYTLLPPVSASANQEVDESHTDIDLWDPMKEEYHHTDNNYAVDDENIEVMTTGYQAKDEKYICNYFSLRGHCPRGSNCRLKHIPLLEGVTRDQEEVYCLDTVPISEAVNNTLVQVSAIITPAHFYVVLPFGCKTVDDIDNLVYKGSSYDEIINSEAKALFSAMDKHYSKAPFKENTTIALSCGTIVAAKRKWDEKWHRGRIVDVLNTHKPSKVFFVDSGDQEWVSRKFIRTILPQYLYTPFQAVQCNLHGIEPIGFKNESSWSSEAVNYFKDAVAGQMLLAEIVHRFDKVFQISLRKTSQNDHSDVAQLLVSAGFAQYQKVTHSNTKPSIYVPG